MPKDKLTQKQKNFCREYVKDFNGTQAAIRSGYSKKTAKTIAAQNLAKLNLQEYIQKLTKKKAEKQEIDAQWVLDNLMDLYQKSAGNKKIKMKEHSEILDMEIEKDVTVFNPNAANKSLELLGKHLGMFTEKIDMNAKVEHSNKLDDIVTQLKDK